MREDVERVLGELRTFLQADGGDVELVDVSPEGTVKVRLVGACGGCAMSGMTLKNGIESVIKKEIPQVTEVLAVE